MGGRWWEEAGAQPSPDLTGEGGWVAGNTVGDPSGHRGYGQSKGVQGCLRRVPWAAERGRSEANLRVARAWPGDGRAGKAVQGPPCLAL